MQRKKLLCTRSSLENEPTCEKTTEQRMRFDDPIGSKCKRQEEVLPVLKGIMYLLQKPHSLRCVTPFLIRLQATSGGQQLCRCYGYRPVPSVTTAFPDGLVQSTRHARRIGGICRRGRWNRKASERDATKCQACNRREPPREWRRPAGCFGASLVPWRLEGVSRL